MSSPASPADPPRPPAENKPEIAAPEVATRSNARNADPEVARLLRPPTAAGGVGWLGGYRVLRLLGRGGMGAVFLAEDPGLGRPVAIKAMLPGLATDAVARERFLREARGAAAVKHDHVVTIHQVGEDNGVPFLVMELLDGESLDDRVRRDGRLPAAEVIRIGRELAEGLAAAHAKGLIHRDVKPANVWLEGPRGRVKLLDFGLARPEAGTNLTRDGAVLGTPSYMPPEQALGKPTDSRADLFSLGCVLYQLATGKMPFPGHGAMGVLMAVIRDVPPAPRAVAPAAVPVRLSDLIVKLLAKDPAARPATAAAVAAELARIRVPNRATAFRRVAAAAGVLAVLAAVGAGAVALSTGGERAPTPADPSAEKPSEGSTPETPVPVPTAVAKADPPGAIERVPPAAPEPPAPTPSAFPVSALRKEKHVPTGRDVPGNVVAMIPGGPDRITAAAFSPDGKSLAVGTGKGAVKLWDLTAWEERSLRSKKIYEAAEIGRLAFSPDGKYLAASMPRGDGLVQMWNVERGLRTGGDEDKYLARSFAFNRTGTVFATAAESEKAEVRLYDIGPDGKLAKRALSSPLFSATSVVFSPDGTRLLGTGRIRGAVKAWDVGSGAVAPRPDWYPKSIDSYSHSVVFNRAGTRLAFPASYSPNVHTVSVAASAYRYYSPPGLQNVPGEAHLLCNVDFSPDGHTVVTGCIDGTVRLCDLRPKEEGRWRTVCTFPRGVGVWHVGFSPDGRHVVAVRAANAYVIRLPEK